MKRRLSAFSTPFWKFIFPAFFITLLIIILILDFGRLLDNYAGTGAPITGWAIAVNLFLLFISVIFYKSFGVMKRVDVDKNYLYVSNYLKEIKIPLSDVEYIGKPYSSRDVQVKLYLCSPSDFGNVIVFIAPIFRREEIVEGLRNRLGGVRDRPDDSPLGNAQLLHIKRYLNLMKGKKSK
jgi:hypothetical protein